MPLIEMAIASICLSQPNIDNQACKKALEATSKQVGFYQDITMIENRTVEIATEESKKKTGKIGGMIVGSGFVIYKSVRDKRVSFKSPTNLGICDTIRGEASKDTYNVKLEWKFP